MQRLSNSKCSSKIVANFREKIQSASIFENFGTPGIGSVVRITPHVFGICKGHLEWEQTRSLGDLQSLCLLTTYKSWDDPPSKGKWSKRLTFELLTHNWGSTHPIALPSWEHFPEQIARTLQGARPPNATLPQEIAGLFEEIMMVNNLSTRPDILLGRGAFSGCTTGILREGKTPHLPGCLRNLGKWSTTIGYIFYYC